jgi:hypothetical protein
MMATPTMTKPTPTRKAPRISVQSSARISTGRKLPVNPCIVLNVSAGGALLYSDAPIDEGTIIQVELGEPIFPIPRLVSANVKHLDKAPDDFLTSLIEKGKIPAKSKGYLLGVEFVKLSEEQRRTLTKFIQMHVREEQRRRAAAKGVEELQLRTARDRVFRLEKPRVPTWMYAIGLLVGAFEIVTGIFNGMDDGTIAWHAGVPMAICWVVGRVTVEVAGRLEPIPEEATIIAATDGEFDDIDELLADADSALDKPPEPSEADDEPDPALVGSGEEVVKTGAAALTTT